MQHKELNIKHIELNKGQIEGLPKNPRFVKDLKFKNLVKSIKENPEMLVARPLMVIEYKAGKYVVIGGNSRLRAIKELKWENAPCVVIPKNTDIDNLKAYTIKDNVSAGDWDYDFLDDEWNIESLNDWGVDLPKWNDEGDNESISNELEKEDLPNIEGKEKKPSEDFFTENLEDFIFESNNEFEIPNLLLDKQAYKLILPLSAWGGR